MTHTHQRLPIDARGEPIRNGDDESADERLECAGWDAIEHAPHGCNPFNFLRVRVGEHLGRGGRVWEGVGGCERGWEGVGGCGRVWEGVGGCGRGWEAGGGVRGRGVAVKRRVNARVVKGGE